MGVFLFVLLLLTGGAAYYEYTWEGQSQAGFSSQLTALQSKTDAAESENRQLTEDIRVLRQEMDADAKAINALETAIANRAAQPAGSLPNPGVTSQQAAALAHGMPLANAISLGDVTTLLGKVYKNCQVLKIGSSDITVSYADGITQIPLNYLPPDIQKRLGYDPQKAAETEAAQTRYQEQLQQAAPPPSNPEPMTQ